MFCDQCGNELEDGQKFCPICGAKVDEIDTAKKVKETSKKEIKKVDKEINFENKEELGKQKNVEKKTVASANGIPKMAIIAIVIMAVVILLFIVNMFLLRKRIHNMGAFKKVDGIDTYYENDSLVKDSLVEYRGKKYYVDNEGHKKKNCWEIIDNDGNWGYFGSLGECLKNQIKDIDNKYYYFDENGVCAMDKFVTYNNETYYAGSDGELLHNTFKVENRKDYYFSRGGKLRVKEGWVRNIANEKEKGSLSTGIYYINAEGQREKEKWIGDAYVDATGKAVRNQWVGEYYVGDKGMYLYDCTTPDGVVLGSDGKPLPGQKIPTQTAAKQTVAQTAAIPQTTANTNISIPRVVEASGGNNSQLPVYNGTSQTTNQQKNVQQVPSQVTYAAPNSQVSVAETNATQRVLKSNNATNIDTSKLTEEEIADLYSGPGALAITNNTGVAAPSGNTVTGPNTGDAGLAAKGISGQTGVGTSTQGGNSNGPTSINYSTQGGNSNGPSGTTYSSSSGEPTSLSTGGNYSGPSGNSSVGYSNGPTANRVSSYGPSGSITSVDDDDDDWDDGYSDDDEEEEEVESEIEIIEKEEITDYFYGEEDDEECEIILLKPIVEGGREDEADIINDCIDGMMDELYEQVETLINGYSKLPKKVAFTSASITSSTSRKLVITLSGTVTPQSGSNKTVKYKINYDRENEVATLTKN